MIELKNVHKEYKNQVIFNNVNITLNKQKIKINGINGVGKSVLLKIITGYTTINKGEILVNGVPLKEKGDFLPSSGVSINAPQFIKSWTGEQNLEYLRKINDISTYDEMMDLVKQFSLEKDIKKKYKTYSLGMQQKMRITQALFDKPKFLILDEPFDALDKEAKVIAKQMIDTFLQGDPERMLIFTSHDEHDNTYADEIYEIENKNVISVA